MIRTGMSEDGYQRGPRIQQTPQRCLSRRHRYHTQAHAGTDPDHGQPTRVPARVMYSDSGSSVADVSRSNFEISTLVTSTTRLGRATTATFGATPAFRGAHAMILNGFGVPTPLSSTRRHRVPMSNVRILVSPRAHSSSSPVSGSYNGYSSDGAESNS